LPEAVRLSRWAESLISAGIFEHYCAETPADIRD
jgi:hypothetical protein